jgi:hypothetical protein
MNGPPFYTLTITYIGSKTPDEVMVYKRKEDALYAKYAKLVEWVDDESEHYLDILHYEEYVQGEKKLDRIIRLIERMDFYLFNTANKLPKPVVSVFETHEYECGTPILPKKLQYILPFNESDDVVD